MKLKTVKSEGLAHNSYFLSDNNEVVVVDPRRDCEVYIQEAKKKCAKIKYILETHRNEDYIVGSLELQNMTEAEIGHSNAMAFKYGQHNLADGETLIVGNFEIKALYTPGHTNESVCYVVYKGNEPIMVFTGDTLFAGSVGRTDLYGKDSQPIQAEKLYYSLQEKVLPLDNGVLVYPAHGAGSVCGHGISGMEPTTIGYEKKTNPYLKLSKEDFLKKSAAEELIVPRYFKKMEEYNLKGPPLLSNLSYPKAMSLTEFEKEAQNPLVLIIDTRLPYAFAGSHIPKALSIWLGGTSVYPGWLLDINQYVIFVHERPTDIETVVPRFRRVGFDNMCGYLCGGINEWQEAGKPFNSFETMPVWELKDKLANEQVRLLDVRKPNEWKEDGYIQGAERIFFVDLPEKANSLPQDNPWAVTCSVGNRTSIACSILEQKGFQKISNVLGGMEAWENLGYPTKKE
jgi:hydroxyacylglutathione hydrolase